MNSFAIIQLATFVLYILLIVVVFLNRQTRLRGRFLIFLIASLGWSLSSFITHIDPSTDRVMIWVRFVPLMATWTIIAYSHFICTFLNTNVKWIARPGYGLVLVVLILVAVGQVPSAVTFLGDGEISIDYGYWMYLLTVANAYFIGMTVFTMAKSFRTSSNPDHRNRIIYLLSGLGLLIGFGIAFEVMPLPRFPIDHIGHFGNALILTYVIVKYQLLDIRLVLRKGLVYTSITIGITTVYLTILALLQYLFNSWSNYTGIAIMVLTAGLLAWLFNPFRLIVQRFADKIFYGQAYEYRQMLLTFAGKMNSVLDLRELAETMLKAITKAVGASQATLLIPNGNFYRSKYAVRSEDNDPVISIQLRKTSPIITRLAGEDRPLSRETVDLAPEFKAMWQGERDFIEAANVELFFPIKNKEGLIGAIAISKRPRGLYSNDDINLLMTIARDSAVAIENAQMYDQAMRKANIDYLTGLYNHRYFHERLLEEIDRCSRFGEVFSLLFIDLDRFKKYNDVHGHLAGDAMLKRISKNIKSSIRGIDNAFRYGGDEFTILLPQTSDNAALILAERILNKMSGTDLNGSSIACSIGIASWPTDGMLKEEIIDAADEALYFAKKNGGQQICLVSSIERPLKHKLDDRTKYRELNLNTIYALAATVDAKDHYTYGHSKKVAQFATELASAMGYSDEKVESIRAAGLLHDIGKIGIADRLLTKPGPLSREEWEPMRAHPNLGVAIVKHVDSLKDCLDAIQFHHERWDGKGYPSGLKGTDIPLDARIMCVADAYDAMTSTRPYRHGQLTPEQGLEELKRCAGTQFDPLIVETFLKHHEKSNFIDTILDKIPTRSHKDS